MQTMNAFMAVISDLSLAQVLTSLGISGGGVWAFWKWFLGNRVEALKLASDTQFRYRELEESRRNKFQNDIMLAVETIRAENKELRQQLFESEDARLKLITKIGELQVEIADLKAQIIKLTTQLMNIRGVPTDAASG